MSKRKVVITLLCLVLLGIIAIFMLNNKPNATNVIKLNYGDGQVTNYELKEGLLFSDLPVEVKEGFQFVGWALDSNGTHMVSLNDVIKDQVEIYAIYSKATYKANIILNGSSYDSHSSDFVVNVQYQDKLILDKPVKKGYTFIKWDVSGKKSKINDNEFTMGVEDATLKAIFVVNKYNITIDFNGGIYDNKNSVTIETEYYSYINLPTPSKDGYVFSGYEFSDGVIEKGKYLLNVDKNVVIKAKWTVNNSSNVNNDKPAIIDNDKKDEPKPSEGDNPVKPDEPSKPLEPEEPDQPGEGEEEEKPSVDETSSVTIYYYLMSSDGQSYVLDYTKSEKVKKGTKYSAEVRNYDNYINPDVITIDVDDKKDYSITYKYTRKKFNLSLTINGGILDKDFSGKYYFGQRIELSSPSKNGYDFDKWNSNLGEFDNGYYVMPTSDSTLSASYIPIVYTITYTLNGGTLNNPKTTYTIEDTFTIGEATLEGYEFVGWASNYNNEVTKNVYVKNSIGNLYFVASFTPKKYEVVLNYNNGVDENQTLIFEHNQKVGALPDAHKDGFTFTGWVDDLGADVTGDYVIVRNNTFTAEYIENKEYQKLSDYINSISNTSSLSKDNTIDNNIRYVGANPSNYINFNGELWRIIGVFNNVEDDLNSLPKVKIIRDDYINTLPFDVSEESVNSGYGVNDFATSDIKDVLNDKYYNSKSITCQREVSVEGSDETTTEDYECGYVSTGIKETSKKFIANAKFYTGSNGTTRWNNSVVNDFYNFERSNNSSKQCNSSAMCNDTVDRSLTWSGKIGLMYLSDFGFATGKNSSACLNKAVSNWWNDNKCLNDNWILKDIEYTMSEVASRDYAYRVFITGSDMESVSVSNEHFVRPVLYLYNDVVLVGGNGTIDNPYTIERGID